MMMTSLLWWWWHFMMMASLWWCWWYFTMMMASLWRHYLYDDEGNDNGIFMMLMVSLRRSLYDDGVLHVMFMSMWANDKSTHLHSCRTNCNVRPWEGGIFYTWSNILIWSPGLLSQPLLSWAAVYMYLVNWGWQPLKKKNTPELSIHIEIKLCKQVTQWKHYHNWCGCETLIFTYTT